MDKLLTLERVIEAFDDIVSDDPAFTYPQQSDAEDTRCLCVEIYEEDLGWSMPDPTNCPWHMNDENTCLYVKDGTSTQPACVVGHYFVELGIKDLHTWEAKSPVAILDAYGYEVEPRAQRFLNSIQANQDQGNSWGESFDDAVHDATTTLDKVGA